MIKLKSCVRSIILQLILLVSYLVIERVHKIFTLIFTLNIAVCRLVILLFI